jgi:hypothetical protein
MSWRRRWPCDRLGFDATAAAGRPPSTIV